MNQEDQTFAYEADGMHVVVETRPDVFTPTSTSVLLLDAVRLCVPELRRQWKSPRVLDLGCGTGISAIVLSRLFRAEGSFFASDTSAAAAALTASNAARMGVALECRLGSLFEPWKGATFDIIVSDVPGVSEPIARASKWFPPPVPCDTGEDGTRLAVSVLDEAPRHLTAEGCMFFPVLTLSREDEITEKAQASFRRVECLRERWFPFDAHLMSRFDLIQDLAARNIVRIRKRGSRWLWATRIYAATSGTVPFTSGTG